MHWPQVTMIVLLALKVGIHLAKHGEPIPFRYSFYKSLFGVGVFVTILWFGEFWG